MYCDRQIRNYAPAESSSFKKDSLLVVKLLDEGDSIYALKGGMKSFEKAAVLFDSATNISLRLNDSLLLGSCYFAQGSIYNAWNGEPKKTIEYYKKAADHFQGKRGGKFGFFYSLYLVAHANDFEKAGDSLECIKTINRYYDSVVNRPDSIKKKLIFTSDLAWVATNVNNYELAEKILNNITKREYIFNDSNTNNYLDHYYLTKSRIEVLRDKKKTSPYLDSLEIVLSKCTKRWDSLYYSSSLGDLFHAAGNNNKAYYYHTILEKNRNANAEAQAKSSLELKLLNLELQNEKRKQELEVSRAKSRKIIFWSMGFALGIISFLSIRNYVAHQKYKKLSVKLSDSNRHLDEKVNEIQLLNKEKQHRLKNNLQMIFSLLHMQERKTESEETIENLQAARLRIESIATLHDHLTVNDNKINFNAFVAKLINNILSCIESENKVVTHLNMIPVTLPANQNFPVSLILNEWITNSIKYANVPSGMLEINISLHKAGNSLVLEYYDNGISTYMPQDKKRVGLGSQIMALLTKQLKGSVTTNDHNPYHYQLTIPHEG